LLQAQEEQKQALLKAQEEQRIRLERSQEEEKRERDRRDLRRFRIAAVAFGALAIAAVATAVWALSLQRKAESAREFADSQRKFATEQQLKATQEGEKARQEATKLAASLQLLSNVKGKDIQAAVDSQSSAAALLPRVYIQIVNENDRAFAKQVAARLTEAGVLIIGIQYVSAAVSLQQSDVRYYRTADQPEAQKILDVIKAAGANPVTPPKYLKGYEDSTRVRPNHYEVWLANGSGGASQ
jgi:hypothetical protein